ncbi:MAG: PCRF domain-containing protein, partial [Bifidobacteriaceae bacterium]|nr:PCRF domain-containing protein [Bifidobacteriaceae bacterium]
MSENAENSDMQYEAAEEKLREFAEIEKALALPETHSDQAKVRSLGRKYAALRQIVSVYKKYKELQNDISAAKELADQDSEFASEVESLGKELEAV